MIERNPNLLNYVYTHDPKNDVRPPLVLVHGLMGDLNNLGMIGRNYANHFNILKVDLVNHGKSMYRNDLDFNKMAADIKKVLDHLGISKAIMIGHSMGGKTVMRFAINYPEITRALVVLDIAPVIYNTRAHDEIFYAINQVREQNCASLSECRKVLANALNDPPVEVFLAKSFTLEEPHKFVFNAPVLEAEYGNISLWEKGVYEGPTAFIYGGDSPYVIEPRRKAIPEQFPDNSIYCVNGAGHWLHAEKPKEVFKYLDAFFEAKGLLA